MVVALAFAFTPAEGNAAGSRDGAPWLAISDVHYGPGIGGSAPSHFSEDTNDALLDSMLAEARRVDPNPPVVVIAGDFLAHDFRADLAAATAAGLAKRFNAVFPRAQFLITLGNNDSACGDYASPVDGPFLAAMARAWEPLVNRNGAAPRFAKTFAHDGSYVATLPRDGLRAIVIDDIPFALRYNPACAANVNGAALELGDLSSALSALPRGSHAWLLLHVPPGIDAYTTSHLTHRLAVVPFTRPRVREALETIVEDPRNPIALVIAGHTHKFGYRILEGKQKVPLLLVPSVSPIFFNAPSFLTLDVDGSGTIDGVREHSYSGGAWHGVGDLASLGVLRFDAPQLLALQRRLAHGERLRADFSHLYSGGGPPEIKESNWRGYWCAATEMSASAYQTCDAEHGFSLITLRGLRWLTIAGVAFIVLVIVVFAVVAIVALGKRKRRRET
jgi:sphingomyelin phosphodiesterase acid-like 3